MSGFFSQTGIPIEAGQTVRFDSEYENSRPHTRVMGINVVYFTPDPGVTDDCALPGDIGTYGAAEPGTHLAGPLRGAPYGPRQNGNAVEIDAPPGKIEKMGEGGQIIVGDRFFSQPNLEVKRAPSSSGTSWAPSSTTSPLPTALSGSARRT